MAGRNLGRVARGPRYFACLGCDGLAASKDDVAKAIEPLLLACSAVTAGGPKRRNYAAMLTRLARAPRGRLRLAGGVAADHQAFQAGVQWLLREQCEDGSWQVTTHSKPFQTYFESGFPYEKSQFVSISGSCWAVIALLLADLDLNHEATAMRISKSPLFMTGQSN